MVTFPYSRTSHDSAADSLFTKESAEKEQKQIPCVIIAFVNRSGSNYIASAHNSTGLFSGFEEILNDSVMRSLVPKYSVDTLPAYIREVRRQQLRGSEGLWGFKAGAAQMAMLYRYRVVPNSLIPSFIRVRRKDVVAQAVSLYIAEQTTQWTSRDKPSSEPVLFSAQRILNHIRSINNSYALIDSIIAVANRPVIDVLYEDLLDTPNRIIGELCNSLQGHPSLPDFGKLELSQQRNSLNEEFRRRFIAEMTNCDWQVSS